MPSLEMQPWKTVDRQPTISAILWGYCGGASRWINVTMSYNINQPRQNGTYSSSELFTLLVTMWVFLFLRMNINYSQGQENKIKIVLNMLKNNNLRFPITKDALGMVNTLTRLLWKWLNRSISFYSSPNL